MNQKNAIAKACISVDMSLRVRCLYKVNVLEFWKSNTSRFLVLRALADCVISIMLHKYCSTMQYSLEAMLYIPRTCMTLCSIRIVYNCGFHLILFYLYYYILHRISSFIALRDRSFFIAVRRNIIVRASPLRPITISGHSDTKWWVPQI